jgi:hypothetical protein
MIAVATPGPTMTARHLRAVSSHDVRIGRRKFPSVAQSGHQWTISVIDGATILLDEPDK